MPQSADQERTRYREEDGSEERSAPGRAALFDVDGTLVDTNYLHTVAWWEAFRQAGHQVPMRDIHHAIGMGGDRLVGHLLGPDHDASQDDGISAAHTALFATWFDRLERFRGSRELLQALAGQGWNVVLASSAHTRELDAMRAAVDAEAVLHDVTSSDDVKSSKPAPDLVQRALDRAGAPAHRAVFVGDTVWDVQACVRAGVVCVGLCSGGIHPADLEAAGAAAVYRDCADLLDHLAESPFGRVD